jgi:hypothetical protein
METLRLVNSYGDVAYGVASQKPLQKQSGRKGLTEGSGAQGAGRAGGSTGGGGTRVPGTYGPSVTGRTAPTTSSTGRPLPGNTAKALTPTESARIYAARKELAKMVGWAGTASSGISYKVTKALSGKPALAVQAKGERVFRTIVDADTRAWLAVAEAAIAAYKAKSVFRPSAGSGKPVSPSTSTTTTDTSAGTSETPTDTSGSSGGASTPAWFSKPYLNEMSAVVGWTGPSYNMPGVTLAVKSTTLDGVAAPVISVTSTAGRDSQTAVDVTPAMAEWAGYASNVVASKAEDDQRKASGTPAPSSGGSSGGSIRVTSDTTSGYNIWSSDGVPSSDSAPAPASSGGGGGSSMRVVEDAPAFAPSGEDAVAPEAVTLVSEDVAVVDQEQGFFAKNKWYVAGGAVALLGGYAYMHRMNPTKYPLPDYLSKLVRR